MKTAVNILIGAVLAAFGSYFLWLEMHAPPTHTTHVIFFGSVAVLGLLAIRPDPIFTVIKRAIVIAGDTNIPWIGGRSADRRKPVDP